MKQRSVKSWVSSDVSLKFVLKSIQLAVAVHNGALVLFYFKADEKPGQSSEKLSPGTVPVPPEV